MNRHTRFNNLKIIANVLLSVLVLYGAAAHAETYKAAVNGMVCAFCAQGIDKSLRKLPQTSDVYVSLKNKVVIIETKLGQTLAAEQITSIIKDAGYDVVSVEVVSGTAQQIKTDMEKL